LDSSPNREEEGGETQEKNTGWNEGVGENRRPRPLASEKVKGRSRFLWRGKYDKEDL